jgi:hypothetical protein
MLLARVVRVNLDNFIQDLREGDLVVWGILIAMVFFTGLGIYQKVRSITAKNTAGGSTA